MFIYGSKKKLHRKTQMLSIFDSDANYFFVAFFIASEFNCAHNIISNLSLIYAHCPHKKCVNI